MKTVLASPIHERLWLQAQLEPSGSASNLAFAHRIDGPLDVDALQGAFDAVVAHHEILRATFHDTEQGLSLTIHEAAVSTLVRQRVDPEEFDEAGEAFIARLHGARFELSEGPVLRGGVLVAGPDKSLLVTVVHDVALDDASTPVLFGQLGQAYEALASGAAVPTWAPSELTKGEAAEVTSADLDYWRAAVSSAPVHTPLPTLPAGSGDRYNTVTVALPEPLQETLKGVAEAQGATFSQVLAAGWAAFIHRLSGEEVVAFAYPVSLRPSGASSEVGCFVNTLPMALDVEDACFSELVRRARGASVAAVDHQHVPWRRIVEGLRVEGRLRVDESFLNLGLAATHLRRATLSLGALEVSLQSPPQARAIWDLLLEFELGSPTRLQLCGREDRSPTWLLEALVTSLLALLERACESPETPVAELPLVDAAQRLRLLAHGQGRDLEPAAAGTLAERFAVVAAEQADAVAIHNGVDGLTYWALDIRSNRTAHALLAMCATPPPVGTRVGLLFDRSTEAVVSMLAAVKLGLTYVPLRPTDSAARWSEQLKASGAVMVMGHSRLLEQLPPEIAPLRFSPNVPGCLSGQPDGPVPSEATPESAACMMYTSDSMGEPRGVLVPHRAVMRLACGGGAHALSAADVVVHGASLATDLSTWEVWGGLLMGARLLVLSRVEMLDTTRLAAQLASHEVTALALPTSLFHAHADVGPASFAGLRLLLVAGDVLEPIAVDAVLGEASGRPERFVNGYGSTENTGLSAVARVALERPAGAVPIGRPIAGSTCYVIDAEGRLAPIGFQGELWVGGVGLALGYDGPAEEPCAHFVAAPEALGVSAGVLFRTGDRVRWRADGQLEFLGRVDRQVTIRGRPLEPGALRAAAMGHADVRQAAAVTTGEPSSELVLAYTLDPRSRLSDAQLLQYLRTQLPPHAIPARRVRVGALPLSSSGELDVATILSIAPEASLSERLHTPPQNDTERALLALWVEQLGHRDVGVLDRFVDVGVDSLRAVRLLAQIQETLGGDLSVSDLYRLGTIRALCGALHGDPETAVKRAPPAPTSSEAARPMTVPLGQAQMGHWHLLRRGMSYTCSCVLHLQGRIDAEVFLEAWDDVMARHEVPWMHLDLKSPQMRRADPRMCNVVRMDLTRLGREAAEYQVLSRVRRVAGEPFVNRAPMLNALLAQAGHTSWYFAFVAPRALVDDRALQLLARELHDTYLARLDGTVIAPPAPMAISDYVAWESARVTEASVEASVAYCRATQEGDATWTIPTRHLQHTAHGETAQLPLSATDALHRVAQGLDVSLEVALTYCALLTLHGVHRAPRVRCLSVHHNRDEEGQEHLPLRVAGAMYQQSRLDLDQSFIDGLSAFGARSLSALPHAQIPPMVLFGMSRQLFIRGTLRHYAISRLIGSLWSMVNTTPRAVLTSTVDHQISATLYDLTRRLTRWFRRARTRTGGCTITIATPLSAYAPLGSTRLPIRVLRATADLPEVIPGDPHLNLHRDAEGIKALFQARYTPAAVRAVVAAYEVTVERVAAAPQAPLGALIDGLQPFADAFEGADDG